MMLLRRYLLDKLIVHHHILMVKVLPLVLLLVYLEVLLFHVWIWSLDLVAV